MKQAILIMLLFGALMDRAVAQQANRFVLNGTLSGKDDGLMYLYYTGVNNERIIDSAVITKGRFSFKGNINEPAMAFLQLKEEQRSQNNSTSFFMEPAAMNVSLTLKEFSSAKFTGSKTQSEFAGLMSQKEKLQKRWKIVMDTLSAINKRSNTEFQEVKAWALHPYNDEMKELDYNFFAKHPQSLVTAHQLRFYVSSLPLGALQQYYNRLGKKMQATAAGKILADEIRKIRNGSPGSSAANFTTNDINGNQLSLADFKGKYVLIDFWASWCVPCRKGNPHLKELYTKYKDRGFEIIGVSDDDSKPDAWHKAVEKDGLPWRHVLRGLDMKKRMKNEPNEKDISEGYGIHSLPTKILVDTKGVIIGRYIGEEDEEALDKKLSEIFGQ